MGAGFLATAMGMTMGAKSVDLPATLGTLALPQGGPTALLAGTLWHYGNGILFTFVYAGVLLALGKQSTVRTGFWFGIALWTIAMLALPALTAAHPLVREGKADNPGVFLLGKGMGWTPSLFSLLDHLLYGVLAGVVYKHSSPQSPQKSETLTR